jgi:hypothetical protein
LAIVLSVFLLAIALSVFLLAIVLSVFLLAIVLSVFLRNAAYDYLLVSSNLSCIFYKHIDLYIHYSTYIKY